MLISAFDFEDFQFLKQFFLFKLSHGGAHFYFCFLRSDRRKRGVIVNCDDCDGGFGWIGIIIYKEL